MHGRNLPQVQSFPSLLSKWRQRYLNKEVEGLKTQHRRMDPEIRAFEEEKERLKRIIAKQALELKSKGSF